MISGSGVRLAPELEFVARPRGKISSGLEVFGGRDHPHGRAAVVSR
jgi:hypothetical protein